MPLTSSNAARQLSDGNSQGTILGRNSSDTIGFYGVTTPRAQRQSSTTVSTNPAVQATSDSAAVSTPTGATTTWGYSSAAQANAIVTGLNALERDVNAIKQYLIDAGLMR